MLLVSRRAAAAAAVAAPLRRLRPAQFSTLSSTATPDPPSACLPLDEIVSFCKRRGFVFPGSELYGSIGTGFDYGPLGAVMKKNIIDAWWRDFIATRPECLGFDSAIMMNPRVWEASGHVSQFCDPLSECATCRRRVRVDKLVQAVAPDGQGKGTVDSLSLDDLGKALTRHRIACPHCGARGNAGLGSPQPFNLLFRTHVGPLEAVLHAAPAAPGVAASPSRSSAASNPNATSHTYLRPETAQGVYVNFPNVMSSTRRKLPLGIGQVGKSFRNEISVGNFVFRTREFEQMELQYFCAPSEGPSHFNYWVDFAESWLLRHGVRRENVRRRCYGSKELAHYALATTDLEYHFPFGWDELWGIANRGDHDLRSHSTAAGVSMEYRDPFTNQSYVPHVIEPAVGVNRLLLAVLADGLRNERIPDSVAPSGASSDDSTPASGTSSVRTVLKIHEDFAPYKVAVLPLLKREPMISIADALFLKLLPHFPVEFDSTQAIGKRYRRQDEIGTPLCVTVDHATVTDGTVTVRCRDSMQQIRMGSEEVLQRAASGTFKRSHLDSRFAAAAAAR